MHTATLRSARPVRAAALATIASLSLIAACGNDEGSGQNSSSQKEQKETPGGNSREVASIAPRALVAHDGKLTLLDTETGKTLDSASTTGFARLSDAGDGRHVVVSDGEEFKFYDTGIQSEPHDDHAHHRTFTPGLSPVTRAASTPGHAVPHHGWTALFSDGSGEVEMVRTADLTDDKAISLTHSTGDAHHGVALRLANGALLHTVGTEKERTSVVVSRGKTELARTDACPGVHGEAAAEPDRNGDVVALGCTDGPVVYRNGAFHKVKVADAYARTGNLAGHHDSPIVLTDYKTKKDATLERPTRIGLLDTRRDSLRTVDLGSSYWFRSLGRSDDGEAVVLTYDGSLRVIDEESGKQEARIAAIGAWQEKEDWQEPGPVLEVVGEYAYVSDPTARELVVINLETRKVVARHELPEGVTELVVTTGTAAEHGDHEGHEGHEGHEHDDHADHDHEGHEGHDHDEHADHDHEGHEGHDHDD